MFSWLMFIFVELLFKSDPLQFGEQQVFEHLVSSNDFDFALDPIADLCHAPLSGIDCALPSGISMDLVNGELSCTGNE